MAAPSPLAPLPLEPTLSRRLWGGERIAGFAQITVHDDATPLGELWTAYAGNRVSSGRHRGRILSDLAREQGAALLGNAALARYGERLPLLAKFIDAGQPLSIQVHPDDAYAARVESASGHLGKGEAWCVLAADEGAEIVWGWRRPVTAAEVRALVAAETLETAVRRVPVVPGDVVYNPPGRVHAVGAGVFLYEIQQDSDLTYRLYDYGRRDASGQLRELHLDKALAVADLAVNEARPLHPGPAAEGWRELVRTPFFVLERTRLAGERHEVSTPHSLAILTAVAGRPSLGWPGGRITLGPGFSLVVPARLGPYVISGPGEVFRASVPPD